MYNMDEDHRFHSLQYQLSFNFFFFIRYPVHLEAAPSPHEAYITRHVSGKNKDDYDNSRRVCL